MPVSLARPSDEPTVNARTLTPSDRRSLIYLCFVLNIGSMVVFEHLAAFFGALVPAENRRVHPEQLRFLRPH